jgi:hypothetical protein
MFKTFYQQEKYPNCKFYFFVVARKERGEVMSADSPLNEAFRAALYNADAHGCCE